jgi:hypothetical protein
MQSQRPGRLLQSSVHHWARQRPGHAGTGRCHAERNSHAPRWGRPRQLRRSSGPSGERSGRWSSVPSLRDRLIAQLKVGATSAELKLVSGSNVTANPAQIAHLPAAQRTSVVKRLQSPGTGS